MILKDLIMLLEQQPDQNKVVSVGFHNPHSYRGDYSQLAFEPTNNVSIAAMLKSAKSALGTTYTGWKGGEYTMGEYTDVFIAERGDCGEPLVTGLLVFMLLAGNDRLEASEKVCELLVRKMYRLNVTDETMPALDALLDEAVQVWTELKAGG